MPPTFAPATSPRPAGLHEAQAVATPASLKARFMVGSPSDAAAIRAAAVHASVVEFSLPAKFTRVITPNTGQK
jgi:hypothetical protein